jgi:predicted kinase
MEGSQFIADARRLAGELGQLPQPEAQPALIVVSGLPGTGKSHFCRRLAERVQCLVLESDALRKRLFIVPEYSAAESAYLFRIIHRLTEELLSKGIPVILDATNLSERHRERLYNIAEHLNARLILVNVKAPPEVVRQRLKTRMEKKDNGDNSDADWEVYQKLSVTSEKIRRNHFAVDTSKDITPALEKIVKEVNR